MCYGSHAGHSGQRQHLEIPTACDIVYTVAWCDQNEDMDWPILPLTGCTVRMAVARIRPS